MSPHAFYLLTILIVDLSATPCLGHDPSSRPVAIGIRFSPKPQANIVPKAKAVNNHNL
jgi:hypothetical protein